MSQTIVVNVSVKWRALPVWCHI